MKIRIGYEIVYECPQPTPMILTLNIHYSRMNDVLVPDHLLTDPAVPLVAYRDGFGNWCSRMVAPKGQLRIFSDAIINDNGAADPVNPGALQFPVEALPEDTLVFLLGSRYCETDRFLDAAWKLFGPTPTGWERVQKICDFVHKHITFGYEHASSTKTAWDVFESKRGVCRDFAHLAIALCRAMNIPARYCTGYLGGEWHIFDPRNNEARIGRILIARGRDAADVAISTSFGPSTLDRFTVICDEVVG